MKITPKVSDEMKELGRELLIKGRRVRIAADHLNEDVEVRLQGVSDRTDIWFRVRQYKTGEIPAMRAAIRECRKSLDEYERQLNLCQAQVNLEAAEVLNIPDLDTRTKTLLVQFGCRSVLDVHKADSWDLRKLQGFGRKCQADWSRWREAHFDENHAAWEKEIERRKREVTDG